MYGLELRCAEFVRANAVRRNLKAILKKSDPQLTKITFQRAEPRYFKWPYHANVMKIFEIVSRMMVLMFFRSRFA